MTGVTATPIWLNTHTKNGKSNSSNLAADFTTLLKQNSPLKSGLQYIAKLSVNNPTSSRNPQSSFLPLESTGQSYTGESNAARKREITNFIYTVRNGNAGEFPAPKKRPFLNFSYAVWNLIAFIPEEKSFQYNSIFTIFKYYSEFLIFFDSFFAFGKL